MAAAAPVLFPEMQERARARRPRACSRRPGRRDETSRPASSSITIGRSLRSIAALFTGGLLPGLVVGLILCAVGLVPLARRGSQPRAARARRSGHAQPPHRAAALGLPSSSAPPSSKASPPRRGFDLGIVYSVIAGL